MISTTSPLQKTLSQQKIQNNTSSNEKFFDRFITILLKIGHYPSLSSCIIKNTKVIWMKEYGLYDIENQKQATKQTIYLVASITKTITSTALMQLYEQGLFDLDDDVNNYLPFDLRNPNFPDDNITFSNAALPYIQFK
jgi:CubicO group peptidase (beta-lactamase class C family)